MSESIKLAGDSQMFPLNQIYTGNATKLASRIPDGSVDLIFTDPPYLKRYMWLYGWLAKEATRLLKPNGFLMTYVGNYWKCEAMALLRRHLDYFWDYTIIHGGDCPVQRNRRTRVRTKSILCYTLKGSKALPQAEVWSAIDGEGKSKQWHEWGQHEDEAKYYIECFTTPGDMVLDLFIGGGTTAVACEAIGRNWIGFEINATQADIARQRVEKTRNRNLRQ
jgi:16S rRNA G966 N2-methylase RsmD